MREELSYQNMLVIKDLEVKIWKTVIFWGNLRAYIQNLWRRENIFIKNEVQEVGKNSQI